MAVASSALSSLCNCTFMVTTGPCTIQHEQLKRFQTTQRSSVNSHSCVRQKPFVMMEYQQLCKLTATRQMFRSYQGPMRHGIKLKRSRSQSMGRTTSVCSQWWMASLHPVLSFQYKQFMLRRQPQFFSNAHWRMQKLGTRLRRLMPFISISQAMMATGRPCTQSRSMSITFWPPISLLQRRS